MSSEAPPIYDVSIFIPSYWADQISSGFDKAYADTHYLKFPIGQGTEYIPDLVVSGTTTLGATSASSLNMGGGNITNVTNINGSAYPQAAGINAVLAAGFTAVNKDMVMAGTPSQASNTLLLNGDRAEFYNIAGSFDTGTLKRDTLTMATGAVKSILYSTGLNTLDNSATPTINNSFLSSGVLSITGSSDSITNNLTPTSSVIADGTYTATLTSNALSLFTNAVLTTRNAISNTGMTITGSTSSSTNTITALTNTITDGTRSISNIVTSSTATIKLLSAQSFGQSTTITPNLIVNSSSDGSATNNTRITNLSFLVNGAAGVSNTAVALSNTITDATRTIFTGISSSIATIKLNAAAAGSGNSVSITPSSINITGVDGTTSSNNTSISSTLLSIIGSSAARKTDIKNPPNGGTGTEGFCIDITTDQNNYSTSNFNTGYIMLNSTNAGAGTTGCVNTIFKRGKTVASNDCIGLTSYVAVGAGAPIGNREFARIASFCKTNTSATDCDGSLVLSARVNTAIADMIELNGAEDQINAFKPLDMNNNSIVSSTGGITLDTSSSASGNPYITLTPNSTGGYIILNNIPVGSGGPAGSIYRTGGGTLHIN